MKKILVAVLFSFCAALAFGQDKIVVAVAPFKAVAGVSQTEVDTIAQIIGNRLMRTRTVDVVSRTKLDEIIREQRFQASDWADTKKTAELGKALSADWIITGELSKVGSRLIIFAEPLAVETHQVMGGADLPVANLDDAYDKIDTLIQILVATMTGGAGGGTAPRPSSINRNAPAPANMVFVEGGTFQMGSSSGESNEKPVHTVTVKSFYMGIYEVTQKEYKAVMNGANPSNWKGDTLPVENVTWSDAVEYCNRLSIIEKLTPAYRGSGNDITCNFAANGYRLPTEAEWEYAAKGGSKDYIIGEYAGGNNADAVAWYSGNSGGRTHEVGTKAPNSLGLYDMSGNVWEWCWDWYGAYSSGAQTDPTGAPSGSARVLRGGGWISLAGYLRSAYRSSNTPSDRDNRHGFRVVRP